MSTALITLSTYVDMLFPHLINLLTVHSW